MRNVITNSMFYSIKAFRVQYTNMSVKKFSQMLSEIGVTKTVISHTTLSNIFHANTLEEYLERVAIAKTRKNVRQTQQNEKKVEETKEQPQAVEQDNPEYNSLLLDELRHTNHLLEAMFQEQKNTSMLIKQLIELWKR